MDDHPIESAKDAILKLIHGVENPFRKEEKEDSDATDKEQNSREDDKADDSAPQSRQNKEHGDSVEGDQDQKDGGDSDQGREEDSEKEDSQPTVMELMPKLERKAKAPKEPKPEVKKGVVDTLKDDHKRVRGLFKEFARSDSMQEKFELGNTITRELTIHSKLEEEIVYKAVKSLSNEQGHVLEGYEEHFIVDNLILEIRSFTSVDDIYEAKMKVLTDVVEHHVKEEEHSILPKVKDYPEQDELTEEFNQRRVELQATEDLWPELSVNGNNSKTSLKAKAKPAAKAKAKPAAKAKAKPAAKAKAKPAAKAKAKPAAKVKAKPAAKVKAKPAAKVKAKPAARAKAKPAAKVKAKPAAKKTGAKGAVKKTPAKIQKKSSSAVGKKNSGGKKSAR